MRRGAAQAGSHPHRQRKHRSQSDAEEAEIKLALEGRLHAYAGKPVGVLARSVSEMAAVLARNPFPGEPGNRTVALFVDDPLPADALDHRRRRI